MYNDSLDNSSVLKLKQILASRFGKGLEIRQLMDVSSIPKLEPTLKGQDLHIPIENNGQVLGTAVIPEASNLDQEKMKDITEVVKLILEPTMYNWFLERRENNLTQLSSTEFSTENLELFDDVDDDEDDSEYEEETSTQKPQMISNLVHLDGKNEVQIKKIALQLHELTHRWAFLPFTDIADQLTDIKEVIKMGAITLFIENVQTLSAAHQDLLLEYLAVPRSDEEPLVVTTSKLDISELRSSDLHPNLIDELEVNTFEVERAPLSHASLREVLELFFFKDSEIQ